MHMITLATYLDHEKIIDVWEQSVRATPYFPGEEYVQEMKSLFPSILPRLKIYAYRDGAGNIIGFASVTGHKMEMLFVLPTYFRRQVGTQLTKFCIHSLHVDEVMVNEKNHSALSFYKKLGYRFVRPDEVDNLGKVNATVHLKYAGISNAGRAVPDYPHTNYLLTNAI
jgi:ribosomal protein S18 acetylase RimI-like enzyme